MCLVLDEIDGSDPHAQRKLAEWMTGTTRKIPVLLTCNEVPRVLKIRDYVDILRCFPPKPADLQALFPAHNVAALAKQYKHDVRRIFQSLQYGESEALPPAFVPTESSPEVAHMFKLKMWCETPPMVGATSIVPSSDRCPH
jgi:hypothetical protein